MNTTKAIAKCSSPSLTFFINRKEFRSWLKKNHKKALFINLGFNKAAYGSQTFSFDDAKEEATCFGWNNMKRKKEDLTTFSVIFVPRGKNSTWGHTVIEAYRKLKALGLVTPAGELAFNNRKKTALEISKPKLSSKEQATFESHSKAFRFFKSQTLGYRNGIYRWILDAKQKKTRASRLRSVIAASETSELLGYWKKMKDRRTVNEEQIGPIPIEEAKNIGPKLGLDLRSIGITTLEQLQSEGWEEVALRAAELMPELCTLRFVKALAGAANDQKSNKLDPHLLAEAKALFREFQPR